MFKKGLLTSLITTSLSVVAVSPVIIASTSCSDVELISVESTEIAILNKATFNFHVNYDIPENIEFAWINNQEASEKMNIVSNNNIPIDQTTGCFNIDFEIIVQPKDWDLIPFDLSFEYKVNGETLTYTIKNLILKNGTTQPDFIKPTYGSTKLITSVEDKAQYSFYFNSDAPIGEIPEKINSVEIRDISDKFKNILRLEKTRDIEVDPNTKSFYVSANIKTMIDEPITFSLLFSYDINGKNYCYYTDILTLILFDSDETNATFLTFKVQNNPGTISYVSSSLYKQVPEKELFYRINNTKYWTRLSLNEKVYLQPADEIDFCGINDTWSSRSVQYSFNIDMSVDLSGSPEALLHGGLVSNTMSGDFCFSKLFINCEQIMSVTPDFLPMHVITAHCYDGIFDGCTHLTCSSAFQLPAKLLQPECYRRMFTSTKITDIKYYSNIQPSQEYCMDWLENSVDIGSIEMPSDVDLSTIERGTSSIPTEWNATTFEEPLTILALYDGKITLHGRNEEGHVDPSYLGDEGKQVLYSFNYPNEEYKDAPIHITSIPLKKGEYIYFKGDNPNGWYNVAMGDDHHVCFDIDCLSELHGNVISLTDPTLKNKVIPHQGDNRAGFPQLFTGSLIKTISPTLLNIEETLTNGCFEYMFYDCKNLINIGNIVDLIHSLSIKAHCCEGMFYKCVGLVSFEPTHDLIPNKYAEACYKDMFSHCTKLEGAPMVTNSEKDLEPHCFEGMFNTCLNLKRTTPVIAKSGAPYCCAEMFSGCVNLIGCTDVGFATDSADEYCFYSMFKNCSFITHIPSMPRMVWAPHAGESMFENCKRLNPAADSTEYINIFKNEIYDACFKRMFYGCTNLMYMNIDIDSWGEDLKNIPNLSNIFSEWLPNSESMQKKVYIKNYGNFQFENIPESFIPYGWEAIPVE